MRTRLTLIPGQNGTKSLLERYGDRLVCVRYRYDEKKEKRYKNVELIFEEGMAAAGRRLPGVDPLRRDRAAGGGQGIGSALGTAAQALAREPRNGTKALPPQPDCRAGSK